MDRISYLKSIEFFKNPDNLDFDYLTNTLTRESITNFVNSLIDQKKPCSVCLMDIDNFKKINDTYGHLKGDEVLAEVANAIVKNIGEAGVVGRWGGDEFIVVLRSNQYNDIWETLHGLNMYMQRTCIDEEINLSITLTTGITRFPLDADTYSGLFETADKALYRGKMKGRNCFIIYLPEKHKDIVLKNKNDNIYSSTYIYNKIFNLFSSKKSLKEIVEILLDYGIDHYMFDHICLDDGKRIITQAIHDLSRNKEFYHIDELVLENKFNDFGIFYCSDTETLKKSKRVHNVFSDQQIKSNLYCKIQAFDKCYGIIRIDTTVTGRVWQEEELNVVLTVSRLLAMALHYNNMQLSDLKD